MQPVKPFFFDVSDPEIDEFLEGARSIMKSGSLILGPFTEQFEQQFAAYAGTKHAIAVNSGTSALEILLRMKKMGGKTVLVPTNTNFATAAAVIRAGGFVRYLDMDPETFAPTLEMVRAAVEHPPASSAETVAGVIWVHIGGVISAEFPSVVDYCRGKGLFVMEDSAHAHGSQLGGVRSGNLADGAAFSFFPTKVMTTFEGGMITTNDDDEDYLARSFRNQGKRGMAFGGIHHDLGNSNRITEISAVLGLIQLRKLPEMLKVRQRGYEAMTGALDLAGIEYVSVDHMDVASHYKLIVLLPEGHDVDGVKKALAAEDVFLGGAVYEIPCHQQPVFEGICAGISYPGAERWCPNHICPPLTSGTTEEQAVHVGKALVRALRD